MEYKRFDNQIVLRLDCGDEISTAVLNVAKAENITLASISGIGAADDIDVGVFDIAAKQYVNYHFCGNHEITSLTGNLTTKDGECYSHLHITLAGEGANIVGGHLLKGIISLTAEIVITIIDGKVDRKFDPAPGINKISF